MLPDLYRFGEFRGYRESRAFAELLIDCEGGPDASGGAGRDAAGGRSLTLGTGAMSHFRRKTTSQKRRYS